MISTLLEGLGKGLRRVLGSRNERLLKEMEPIVDQINAFDAEMMALSDGQLAAKTDEFRNRLADGETLDDLLPEAFAVVRETARRVLITPNPDSPYPTMRHFDVQLIGGIVLHQGKIAEMVTGEGKTLVATLPAYLNALAGEGVHIVTVNDYLARRDCEWMRPMYEFLHMTSGVLQDGQTPREKQEAYACDVTFGTDHEFGFDYLRDNMRIHVEEQVQKRRHYAIIDEVDSVLIDEARTPLIISGPVERKVHAKYAELDKIMRPLARRQASIVSRLVKEGKQALDEGNERLAGIKLLQAKRGLPRDRELMKVLADPKVAKLTEQVDWEFKRDKREHELDTEILFLVDERARSASLTQPGMEFLSPNDPNAWIVPDIWEELNEIDSSKELSPAEKEEQRAAVWEKYHDTNDRIKTSNQLLVAHAMYQRDVDYVVKGGQIVIVDEFTGRLMPGRRWSDGLHEAVEAKEKVKVKEENQTLATITYQNFFRLYDKLSGMTGTAATEANEFFKIYRLEVVAIPTNKELIRLSYPDVVYRTEREKWDAIEKEILDVHKSGRPVLVGTISIEKSELISEGLNRAGIKHEVLNAKHHEREAQIIAKAGQRGNVTIATNMAGRGTDIMLGEGVSELGGLHIIGTERHEARRIDNQLRGRAGRQGDPGSSRFFLSLEDDLMRIFASERVSAILQKIGMEEGMAIEHGLVTRSIEKAQRKVEERNFSIRENLLKYDEVMDKQRKHVYARRQAILEGEDQKELILSWLEDLTQDALDKYLPEKGTVEEWDIDGLLGWAYGKAGATLRKEDLRLKTQEEIFELLMEAMRRSYAERESLIGDEQMRLLERYVLLDRIDTAWKDHLYAMDDLKEGIHLRGWGGKDPKDEYKTEGTLMFDEMVRNIQEQVTDLIFKVRLQDEDESTLSATWEGGTAVHEDVGSISTQQEQAIQSSGEGTVDPIRVHGERVGRNDPCPCGSGKKFKKCCGR
ncbi:MAG: preprotein translocase subunit SecA [Planctomycetes bacterium]|nr:preprotein translocase subunit SecA [Planctomycetota bacterium]